MWTYPVRHAVQTDFCLNHPMVYRRYMFHHHWEKSVLPKHVPVPCLPDYYDYVYSIYGIGWTTDLEGTFRKIASYL